MTLHMPPTVEAERLHKQKHNIIGHVKCCWRCGMTKEEVRRTQHGCSTWGKSYAHHLWTLPEKSLSALKE